MNELKVTNVPYFFALWRLSEAQILDGTKNLKKRKKLPVDDIPTKIIKDKKKNFKHMFCHISIAPYLLVIYQPT